MKIDTHDFDGLGGGEISVFQSDNLTSDLVGEANVVSSVNPINSVPGFENRAFEVTVDDTYLYSSKYDHERAEVEDYIKESIVEVLGYEAVNGVIPDAKISLNRQRENPDDSPIQHLRRLFSADESVSPYAPTLNAWFKDAMHATALHPLQQPEIPSLADGVEVVEGARPFFRHTLDAMGIRSRASVMAYLMERHFSDLDSREVEWLSVACGAAVPVLQAAKKLVDQDVSLTLVDNDPNALKFAEKLVNNTGLQATTEIFEEDVIGGYIRTALQRAKALNNRLGKDFDAIDILGLFEYLRPKLASSLLQRSYDGLKPGGMLVMGNMLKNHPQLGFHKKIVRWPGVQERSASDLASIIEHANIPLEATTLYLPNDNVYGVVAITKS